MICHAAQHLEVIDGPAIPALDGAGCQSGFRVLDNFFGIKELFNTQSVAGRAGTRRVVKGKQFRLELAQGIAALGAGITGGEGLFFPLTTHGRHKGNPVRQVQGGFETLGKPLLQAWLDLEPIDDHINLMFAFFVQGRHIVDVINRAVHAQADKALAAHGFDNLQMFAFPIPDYRCQDHEFAVLWHGHHLVYHLADGLRFQGLAMVRAPGLPGAGEEQAQVIVDFCDGANGGARVVGSGLLLNGYRWRQPFDMVHIRLLHHREKLAGIGRQRLHITSLPFSIERIERKGRFTGTGEAGNHDQFVPWHIQVDVLQVVGSCPFDLDMVHNTSLG